MSSVFYRIHFSSLTLAVSRAFKQRTITRIESRTGCMEERTDDAWRNAPMISERAAIEARRMPGVTALTRCTCKGKCDTKSCSCFRKGRSCTYRCHKGAEACKRCNTGVTNTVQPTFTAPPMPVVVVPTIPNPGVIVAEPPFAVAAAATPIYFEVVVVAEPPVAVAATPICFEVVAAPTQKRVRRVMRIPERFND
jgi:hypothetical protein